MIELASCHKLAERRGLLYNVMIACQEGEDADGLLGGMTLGSWFLVLGSWFLVPKRRRREGSVYHFMSCL